MWLRKGVNAIPRKWQRRVTKNHKSRGMLVFISQNIRGGMLQPYKTLSRSKEVTKINVQCEKQC